MKTNVRKILALAGALTMLSSAALADTVSFDGTVMSSTTCDIITPLSGTVDQVYVKAGQVVEAGEALASLRTTRTVAQEDGVVTAVFGQAGDDATQVVTRYGAVLYLEGNVKYTMSVNLRDAYSDFETTFVHAGQQVWLRGRNKTDHQGVGIITLVEESSYTVEVQSGDFIVGESVNVYLNDAMKDAGRLGRGSIARKAPTAITVEEGTLVNVAVSAGDTVKRGDLLMETLSGTCEPQQADAVIRAQQPGVIASVQAVQAEVLTEDATAFVLYPVGSMQVEGTVSESDLSSVQVGKEAMITLDWNEDESVTYAGQIAWIAASAEETDTQEAVYKVIVTFTPDANTRYGMSATVEVAE